MDPHRDSPVTEESRTRGEISIIQFKLFELKLYAFHFKFLSYNDDNYDDNDFILHCILFNIILLNIHVCETFTHDLYSSIIVQGIFHIEEVHSRCFDGCITCNTNYVGYFSNVPWFRARAGAYKTTAM